VEGEAALLGEAMRVHDFIVTLGGPGYPPRGDFAMWSDLAAALIPARRAAAIDPAEVLRAE